MVIVVIYYNIIQNELWYDNSCVLICHETVQHGRRQIGIAQPFRRVVDVSQRFVDSTESPLGRVAGRSTTKTCAGPRARLNEIRTRASGGLSSFHCKDAHDVTTFLAISSLPHFCTHPDSSRPRFTFNSRRGKCYFLEKYNNVTLQHGI